MSVLSKIRSYPPLTIGLVLSLLAHLIFLTAKLRPWRSIAPEDMTRDSKPIEITELPPEVIQQLIQQQRKKAPTPKTKELEIAETEDAANRELDPDAKFLS